MLNKKTLAEIRHYFLDQSDVLAVYLYGSQASGKAHSGSDLDLAVLFNQPPKSYRRQFALATDLSQLLPQFTFDVRQINLESSPVFLMSVLKNGRPIFSRDETGRSQFEVAVMQTYIDSQKLRDIQYKYFQKRLKQNYASPN